MNPVGEYTERQQLCVSFVPVTYVVNACRVLCPCVSWLSVKSCDSAGGNNPAMLFIFTVAYKYNARRSDEQRGALAKSAAL